jgi:methionine synthase II (cobalamin-independent)
MSTGYCANYAETISKENLIKVVKDKRLVNNFIKKFTNYRFAECETADYDELAMTVSGEDIRDIDQESKRFKELKALWDKIAKKFKDETGIDLYINYHDANADGDCYDEVDGLYFNFYHRDLYKPTKAYKDMMAKFGEDIVERQFFVQFG